MSDLYSCCSLVDEDEFFYTRGNSTFFTFPQPDSRRAPYCNIYLVQAIVHLSTGSNKSLHIRSGVPATNVYSNDRKRLAIQGLLTTSGSNNHFTLGVEPNYPVRTASNFTTIEILIEDELGDEIPIGDITSINCLFRVDYLETNELRDEILESYLPVNRLLN